ncbi:MAG: hypothetical protein VX908_02370 [Planctomycetota bacterium]|nr:hypothetical protein [Planctomycetota bacterium]
MSRFNSPAVREGGGLNVYTGLSGVAALLLLAGCLFMVFHNIEFSAEGQNAAGEMFKILGSN